MRLRAGYVLVWCLSVWVWLPGAAAQSSTDGGRFLRWSYEDAGALVRGIDSREMIFFAATAAVLAPMSLVDPALTRFGTRNNTGTVYRYFSAVNPLGGPRVLPVAIGLFGVTLLTDNARLQDAAFTSIQGVVYAGVVMIALKTVIGRSRPGDGRGHLDFRPFTDFNAAFPSGHSATVFAIVTPWILYYPGVPTYLMSVVAVSTSVARVVRNKHWVTDVVAGGILGWSIGRALTRQHKQATPTPPRLTPSFSLIGPQLTLRWEF